MLVSLLIGHDAAEAQDGYLFRQPQVTLGLRVGGALPNAGSDIFDFLTSELTIDRGDFAAISVGGDVGIRLAPQIDLLVSGSVARSSTQSEFREWTDNNDLPIEQETKFTRVPVAASIKYYFAPRGRSLSKFAWVPERFLPYFGVGAGVMWYKLEQAGDFVDFESLAVFPDQFESSGTAPMVHALAGAEWWFTPRVGLTVDGRYALAKADLDVDYSEWGSINLSGFQLTTGLALRF